MKIEKDKPKNGAPAKTKKVEKKKTPSLQKLVSKNPHFQFLSNGKIKCILTGHEMEPTLQNFQRYQKSKSFIRGLQSSYSIEGYEDYLVQHRQYPNFFFCQLTGSKVAKKKSVIQKHIQGKKFQRRLSEIQVEQNQDQENDIIEQDEEEK